MPLATNSYKIPEIENETKFIFDDFLTLGPHCKRILKVKQVSRCHQNVTYNQNSIYHFKYLNIFYLNTLHTKGRNDIFILRNKLYLPTELNLPFEG
jgi:hypothetical protein